ncbi:Zinc finger, CCCH-type [Dillenia turbinata]|uniref:Zinc finger, CCCH-type n=1 Tax=Dillenia turbinata TaxID=194707 RepID=A0AAN8VIM6_9MAGN
MANKLYGHNPISSTYAGAGAGSPARSFIYSGSSLIGSSRFGASDSLPLSSVDADHRASSASSMFFSQSNPFRFSASSDIGAGAGSAATFSVPRVPHLAAAHHHSSWPAIDVDGAGVESVIPGIRRPTEVLYHQSVIGVHNTVGQSDAWLSANSLAKRPRLESASNLPIYPQRPGQKDCAHYMLTRTCKFGDSCKFDHPIWVPEGGIPDWKEVSGIAPSEALPERPGEPDCPYFLKTQRCKFGTKCKFNHPKDKGALEIVDVSALPERPSEPACSYYLKTGKCKFGASCKFDHPKDAQVPQDGQDNADGKQTATVTDNSLAGQMVKSVTPALAYNPKGLPIRLVEVDCPFYLKTGSCKYGASCCYNHPDRTAINPLTAALGPSIMGPSAANLNIGVVNPAASIFQALDPRVAHTMLGLAPTIYPQRPGQIECDFYMKTGECKFGERCKFHHPIDRSVPPSSTTKQQQGVKLTLAGLPRREGETICSYYLKTSTCKYGAACKFDHPSPGEVMAMAAKQGTSESAEGKEEKSVTV